MLTHQHMAEVSLGMSACAIEGRVSFVPQSGPFVRGIFATIQFASLTGRRMKNLGARANKVFEGCPFVRMVEESPRVAAVVGTNFADIGMTSDAHSTAIMVALDNLGKGMAGQAVQAMNIALDLPETAGLWTAGRYPI
jgi:N-acetyl-gamma-glutamyl-phosphate reductase